MVRLTTELIARSMAQRRRSQDNLGQSLQKITHLNLSDKSIDVIVRCISFTPFTLAAQVFRTACDKLFTAGEGGRQAKPSSGSLAAGF